jgi:hypothetical protein
VKGVRWDHGTAAAEAMILVRIRQIIREVGGQIQFKDDKPCQRLCAKIISRIDEEAA